MDLVVLHVVPRRLTQFFPLCLSPAHGPSLCISPVGEGWEHNPALPLEQRRVWRWGQGKKSTAPPTFYSQKAEHQVLRFYKFTSTSFLFKPSATEYCLSSPWYIFRDTWGWYWLPGNVNLSSEDAAHFITTVKNRTVFWVSDKRKCWSHLNWMGFCLLLSSMQRVGGCVPMECNLANVSVCKTKYYPDMAFLLTQKVSVFDMDKIQISSPGSKS